MVQIAVSPVLLIPSHPADQTFSPLVIQYLITLGLMKAVPHSLTGKGIYSRMFLVLKKEGSFWPVVDIPFQNVLSPTFKMLSLHGLLQLIPFSVFCFVTIDLKDVYNNFPIVSDFKLLHYPLDYPLLRGASQCVAPVISLLQIVRYSLFLYLDVSYLS